MGTHVVGGLDHLRWIGGGTGAGKTAVARRLSERFGLSVYDSDATIRVHTARLGAAEAPLLDRFTRLSMDERWVLRDPGAMYETFPWFHGEGFDLLIEDLLCVPSGEVTVVEGFRLLPRLVRAHLVDQRHAVWLIPTPSFRRAVFAGRTGSEAFWHRTRDPQRALANLLERDRMFTDVVAAEATALGLGTLTVDGTRSLDDTVDALSTRFRLESR